MNSVSVVDAASGLAPIERREHFRVRAAVPIEFREEGTPIVIRAETSDISLGGCYVEMMFTFEIDTKLHLVLWANGERLRCSGAIVTRHLQVGNGIKFLDMSPQDRRRLQNLLESPVE